MSREVKRVPMDFDWPMKLRWVGYCLGESMWDDGRRLGVDDELLCDLVEKYTHHLRFDPPAGEGWQMWETVSEGSPMSPVFATPEELAQWLADTGASALADRTATYDQWLKMIHAGWAISAMYSPSTGWVSGVEFGRGETT